MRIGRGVETHSLGGEDAERPPDGGRFTRATAINSSGQIVGQGDTASGGEQATLFRIGSTTPIDLKTGLSPADQMVWQMEQATAINNRGQICGTGMIHGQTHAFLMTPETR